VAAVRPPVEETTMRTAKVLVLGLMLTLASAGCARNSDDGTGVATAQSGPATASAGPSPTASRDPDAMLKFAKCMRQNGVTWFPDPDSSGRTMVKTPKGFDPKKFEAAQEACKQYAPTMDGPAKADPEMLEKMRQMSKCMRENGVPNFPDPQPNGGIAIDGDKVGMGPGDPTFDKAEEKCSKFMPKPGDGGGPETNSDGAGEATA
jgi:hypothetical protein